MYMMYTKIISTEDHDLPNATAGLTSIFPQSDVNELPTSLSVNCGKHIECPAVVDFLDRNDRYSSVATQIPHDAALATIP